MYHTVQVAAPTTSTIANLQLDLVENVLGQLPGVVALLVDAYNHPHALLPPVVGFFLGQGRQRVLPRFQ